MSPTEEEKPTGPERLKWNADLCRDSTEAGSNLLKLSVTDGFFWRFEVPLVTVIGPLLDLRPLSCKPLPLAAAETRANL